MLQQLREEICEANQRLPETGLVVLTWGNVSGIDRTSGIFGIKPSGIDYKKLKPSDIVLLDLEGQVVEGTLNPSSDTRTHLELYRAWPEIGGITHTHSPAATCLCATCPSIIQPSSTCAITRRECSGDFTENLLTTSRTPFTARKAFKTCCPCP